MEFFGVKFFEAKAFEMLYDHFYIVRGVIVYRVTS